MYKGKANLTPNLKIVLGIIVVAIVVSAVAFLSLPSIQMGGFGGYCEPISMDVRCATVSDCHDSLPSDMPGDINDVGTLSCMDSECFFTPFSCINGIIGGD